MVGIKPPTLKERMLYAHKIFEDPELYSYGELATYVLRMLLFELLQRTIRRVRILNNRVAKKQNDFHRIMELRKHMKKEL